MSKPHFIIYTDYLVGFLTQEQAYAAALERAKLLVEKLNKTQSDIDHRTDFYYVFGNGRPENVYIVGDRRGVVKIFTVTDFINKEGTE